MIEMPSPDASGVTADDLRTYDWQSVIAAEAKKECYRYFEPLVAKAEELGASGDLRGKATFTFISRVAILSPTQSAHESGCEQPIDRLSESDLDALAAILLEILDPEMRAKIAHILWVRRKDYRAAQQAVEAYILAAVSLEDPGMWPPFTKRLEQALTLGAKLGKGKPLYAKAVAAIENAIARHEDVDTGLMSEELMGLLLAYRAGDPTRYSSFAARMAQRLAGLQKPDFARRYWEIKARWDWRAGDEPSAAAAMLAAAECCVSEAEGVAALPGSNFMSAAYWMTKGIHALRKAKADPARIDQAHKKLLEYQRQIVGREMGALEVDPDEIPGMREAQEQTVTMARNLVKGKTLPEAVLALAWKVARPVDTAELRQRVEEQAQEFIANRLFGSITLSAKGKVTDTQPPISPHDAGQTEEAHRKEMFLQARQVDWQLKVKWKINPAREQVESEYPLSLRGLAFLVANHPFVPAGREGIFLRGLHAGFMGDFLVAAHLLIPQLENSIRTVLEDQGLITSMPKPDNKQDESDLGWLLRQPGMEKAFGVDMTFDLRGVLTERFGHNLRNEMSHGLMSEGAFYSDASIYAWWLALRLCTWPLVAKGNE